MALSHTFQRISLLQISSLLGGWWQWRLSFYICNEVSFQTGNTLFFFTLFRCSLVLFSFSFSFRNWVVQVLFSKSVKGTRGWGWGEGSYSNTISSCSHKNTPPVAERSWPQWKTLNWTRRDGQGRYWAWDLILPNLPANRFACYCFMDAGRRHERSGSETKDFMTLGVESILCLCPPCPVVPLWGAQRVLPRAQMNTCIGSELYYSTGTLSLGNLHHFIARSMQACFLFQGRHCLVPQGFSCQTQPWEMVRAMYSWHAQQDVQKSERPMEDCFSQ